MLAETFADVRLFDAAGDDHHYPIRTCAIARGRSRTPYGPLATEPERVGLIAHTGLAARQELETESLDMPFRAPFADPPARSLQ
jgi:hypothetical protein